MDQRDDNETEQGYVKALALTELPDGELRSVRIGQSAVLLANVGGTIHAIGGICTHEQEDLADGEIEDGCVVCPMHFARFSLETGAVMDGPAPAPEPVYDVLVEDGAILVGRRRD